MRFQWLIILILMFAFFNIGSSLHERDEDVKNITDSIVWNYTIYNNTEYQELTSFQKIIHKTIDWGGFCTFESAKIAINYGYNNPKYNYGFFITLIRAYLYIVIIKFALPVLILFGAILFVIFDFIKKKLQK